MYLSLSPLNYMRRVGGVSALSLVLRHQIILEEDRHIFSLIFYNNNNFNAFNVPMWQCAHVLARLPSLVHLLKIPPSLYRARNKGMLILLSNSQAGPGRTVKQEQEEISRNHVQAFIPGSVLLCY